MSRGKKDDVIEIAIVGDLTENEADICGKLLDVAPGAECTLYFDSPGGSCYTGVSLLTLIAMRDLHATGIVMGECSSAALWPLAACRRRLVTPYSFMLFHPMRWQSEENVGQAEAAEWARHFAQLERETENLLAAFFAASPEQIADWMKSGRYISGREFAEAGLAELIDLTALARENPKLEIRNSKQIQNSKSE